jgi:hypothetical protein
LPFVQSITFGEVTKKYGDNVFDRDIAFRGARFTERITLEASHPIRHRIDGLGGRAVLSVPADRRSRAPLPIATHR